MVLVEVADVGVAAWHRMVREGVITPLSRTAGHPPDVPSSAALRGTALAPAVPQRAALTGLSALWVYGWGPARPAPSFIEVAVPRGSHPDAPIGTDSAQWSFVTDQLACRTATRVGGVAVVLPADAIVAALARAHPHAALESAWWALSAGLVDRDSVNAAIRSRARTPAHARARSAWDAVCTAAGAR